MGSKCSYCRSCINETICSCDTDTNCNNPLKSEEDNSNNSHTDWWVLSGIIIGLLAVTIVSSVIYIGHKIAREDHEIRMKEIEKMKRKQQIIKKRKSKVKFKEKQKQHVQPNEENKSETVKTASNQMEMKQNESMDESVTIELPADDELVEEPNEIDIVYQPHTHNESDTVVVKKTSNILPAMLTMPRGSCKVQSHSMSMSSDRYNAAMEEIDNCTPDIIKRETNLSLPSRPSDERFKHSKYESYQL